MKKRIALLLSLVMLVATLSGCSAILGLIAIPGIFPTEPTIPEPTVDATKPVDPWADYQCITIAEALTLCEQFVDAPSAERYYIRATVKSIDNETYGEMTIEDATGSMMVYGSYSADGSVRYDAMTEKPVAGDEVLLYGTLQNYNGNIKEVQNARIIDFIPGQQDDKPAELPADGSELTIAQILALPIASGVTTEQHYIVKATVDSVTKAEHGAMLISDSTGSISVYNSKNADGSKGYAEMEEKPYKGDSVTLKCTVQNFNGTMEIKQAYILEFTPTTIDPSQYTAMSVADARKADAGAKVRVTGVVAQITYANGMIPSGVILVDNTSSIYVYDVDLAARVSVGNTIELCASKTYWILDTEQTNANKFGYKGCNQLENALLVSNDEGNTVFDKSWIETATVKSIMDTAVNEDITTKIFKVTALIKKDVNPGYVNYYINDLDGATGSYVYTQCNGGDFGWLDAFDGKICTVYVMALNAKSSASGCVWRFLPVSVIDENFDPSTVNFAENAVKYYGVTQFLPSYTGNPALKLETSATNALLGYTDIALSYQSSDPSIISIDENVMNCHEAGTATITVTAVYNGVSYSENVTITVEKQQSVDYVDVNTAINKAVGEKVTVKGIVGPSLANKVGFYLIDETGVIAVETTADVMAALEIGHEVVLAAVRANNTKGGANYYGQTCLKEATVVLNNYGTHDYSTASFKGNISVADFYNLDATKDYTTSVYTMKATVVVTGSGFSVNVKLADGDTQVSLYSGNQYQYAWLAEMAGQEVTVEIAACNWNDKTYYRGCVLAVINSDGTKILNTYNFDN